MMKIFIIANRLPVQIERHADGLRVTPSAGGLATGLGSLETTAEKYWIGWPGIHAETEGEKTEIRDALRVHNFFPVFLDQDEIENYYEGYSNSTIWPLCHYFPSYVEYKSAYWEAYQTVNERFAEAARPLVEAGDAVWVQDYQLMLLPALLRACCPGIGIGYFHHIPFPSYELFRALPERKALLNGLLGADLIGFHTHDYMRHFISTVYRVLNLNCHLDEINLRDRIVHVDTFPMGINYDHYRSSAEQPDVIAETDRLKEMLGQQSVILSVDRLDYSKGILHRLEAFAGFLDAHPEYREEVSLAMIVVPSRDSVEKYADLKEGIDRAIGDINGRFSTMSWTPIHYFYRPFPFTELMALYRLADVCLVTPLRDGMNLVAKEYLAAKRETDPGVLILSEMAGAAVELDQAIIINPNDLMDVQAAILTALSMPQTEKRERLLTMQRRISKHNVNRWANDFLQELQSITAQNREVLQQIVGKRLMTELREHYEAAKNRLLVLDYDGTLAPFTAKPAEAMPSPELLDLLKRMKADAKNTVVINSGRDKGTLDAWFAGLGLDFAAEHGAVYKQNNTWTVVQTPLENWDEEIMAIMTHAIEKTPGASLEVKDTSLVWHYRNVDVWLAELRAQQLINALIGPAYRLGMQVVPGHKIVEIKPASVSKGVELERRLNESDFDFVLAIGDDTTDEDMFNALPADGISIKVGDLSAAAKYRIPLQSSVLPFLDFLTKRGVH